MTTEVKIIVDTSDQELKEAIINLLQMKLNRTHLEVIHHPSNNSIFMSENTIKRKTSLETIKVEFK